MPQYFSCSGHPFRPKIPAYYCQSCVAPTHPHIPNIQDRRFLTHVEKVMCVKIESVGKPGEGGDEYQLDMVGKNNTQKKQRPSRPVAELHIEQETDPGVRTWTDQHTPPLKTSPTIPAPQNGPPAHREGSPRKKIAIAQGRGLKMSPDHKFVVSSEHSQRGT